MLSSLSVGGSVGGDGEGGQSPSLLCGHSKRITIYVQS